MRRRIFIKPRKYVRVCLMPPQARVSPCRISDPCGAVLVPFSRRTFPLAQPPVPPRLCPVRGKACGEVAPLFRFNCSSVVPVIRATGPRCHPLLSGAFVLVGNFVPVCTPCRVLSRRCLIKALRQRPSVVRPAIVFTQGVNSITSIAQPSSFFVHRRLRPILVDI